MALLAGGSRPLTEGGFIGLIGVDTVAPPTIKNETSPAEVAAWARANGLSIKDCVCLLQAGYTGTALLKAREHELRQDGLSAGGAAELIDLRKGTPAKQPLCRLHASRIFRPAHPVPLGSAGHCLR